ncbi:MAG: lipoyl synthase [Chitinophagaceae bacterium]
MSTDCTISIKPNWLKGKLPTGKKYLSVRELVDNKKLHTICESGNCPNMGKCWSKGIATFMILGSICTRSCQFCAVSTGKPEPVDWEEPQLIAESISTMGIKHAVITSVDRDDLPDLGSTIWKNTIYATKTLVPQVTLETLIPDFKGREECLDKIIDIPPEVVSHNIETVERLSKKIRIQAKYNCSMKVLNYLKKKGMRTKSGIMLGVGENRQEILQTMKDLFNNGVDVLTLGQYLQPTKKHLAIHRFVTPEEFEEWKNIGYEVGFDYVESSPLVRSSYGSEKHIFSGIRKKQL